MSNRCSNLCNHKSFSFCTPLNPYSTTRFPLFPIQHSFILIGRRSRGRSSSVPLKVAAQSSSSDLVLIATQEHHDGSLVFQFGDASEVVENIESQTEQQSSAVKVLDGDQDRQVIINTDDSVSDSVEGRLVEVADGIRNTYIGSDISESETNGAESSDTLSDISEKEVLVSQPDANLNDFNNIVESTLDEAKFGVELDEEASSDPNIYLVDKTPNIDRSVDPEGTVLKGSDDKSVDPSVSVVLESTQVSQIEVVDDLDNVEAEDASKNDTENVSGELESMQVLQTEVVDDLDNVEAEDASKSDTENASSELESTQVLQTEDRKSDTEDISPSAFPTTMAISDVELTDAANEDVEEDSKDMIVNEGTLIDELPLYNPLNVQLMDAVNEDADEESQDMNINEATIIDEISTDQLIVEQPTLDEVSKLKAVDVKDQTTKDGDAEEELQDMNINEATIIDEMSSSDQLVVEQPTLDEVSQPQSTPLDLQDILGQDRNNEIMQVDTETKDPSVSVNLEAIQVSDNEVMDATQPYTEDESRMVESKDTSEGDTQDLLPPATMHVSDVDGINERLQDVNISEATAIDEMPTSDPLRAEPTLEVSTTKDIDVNDVVVDERLQDMNVSDGNFIDEMPTSDPLGVEPTLEVSTANYTDVKDVDTDERLQDTNISEGTLIDEMPTSDLLGAEPTFEVSATKDMDVKDVDADERWQDMNTSEGTFGNDMPTSDPLGADRSLQVSTTKDMDVKDVDMDEMLKDNNISEGTFIDEITTSDPLGAEPTLEVSTAEDVDVNVRAGPEHGPGGPEELLQDMNVGEGTFIDEMPTSDPVGTEPTLEVSTTEGLGVKDLSVAAELQLVSNDNKDENSNAELIPAEPIVEEEEASQPRLVPVELKATMKDSDIKLQDGTVDDEILQVIGEDADDSYIEDVEESSHKIESQPLQDEGVNHDMSEQCAETDAPESSILLKQGAHDPLLEAERTEGVVGSSELAEASEVTALLLAAEAEVEREEIYLTDDILLSGAALLEHPFKVEMTPILWLTANG